MCAGTVADIYMYMRKEAWSINGSHHCSMGVPAPLATLLGVLAGTCACFGHSLRFFLHFGRFEMGQGV